MDAASQDLTDLTRPLGVAQPSVRPRTRLHKAASVLVAVLSAVVLGALAYAALFGSGQGGMPIAEAPIRREPALSPALGPVKPDEIGPVRTANPTPPSGAPREAGEIEAASGVAVIRPAGASAPGSVLLQVPDAPGRLAPAPDPRLVERTRHGALPRVGPDGARALNVYRRKPAAAAVSARRVAIVVGGLGIGQAASIEAIDKLPPAVTLAFAPYGQDLDRLSARAREAGHEIVLQVPMEPFDYPDSDPGPHTLTAAARPSDNMDHLHWAMGRFTGYVGLMNYMGAKLTADERALAPILREAGARGLGVFDDGSSSRSLVAALGGETPTARAEIVLDAAPRADLIDKALGRLEAGATSGKVAVASASALPVTLERIARWAAGLEARGFVLVPVSSALSTRASGRP